MSEALLALPPRAEGVFRLWEQGNTVGSDALPSCPGGRLLGSGPPGKGGPVFPTLEGSVVNMSRVGWAPWL